LYDILVYLLFVDLHVSDSVSVTALHAILQTRDIAEEFAVIPIIESPGRDTPQYAGEICSLTQRGQLAATIPMKASVMSCSDAFVC